MAGVACSVGWICVSDSDGGGGGDEGEVTVRRRIDGEKAD